MNYLLVCVIAYLFGCIQTSYIAGRLILKKDIRELGNGNAGASNATVVFGKRFGLLTVVVDILKAVIALAIIKSLIGADVSMATQVGLLHLAGLFVILGHNFPFHMGFKGGKGTAALVGVMFGFDWRLGLLSVVTVFVVTLITDYIVLGTVGLLILLLVTSLLNSPYAVVIVADVIIIIMSLYKHRQNFINIKNGQEKHVRKALFGKKH